MRVSTEVIEVLAHCEIEGSALRITDQLERKLYVQVDKALQCAGGKWNTRAKAHLFPGCAAAAIEPIILDGEITDAKREFDAFYTPADLVERMLDLARLEERTPLVLEPSAGSGNIVAALKARGCTVLALEIRPESCAQLQASVPPPDRIRCVDFLADDPAPAFDAVVMNPPFSKRQDSAHIQHAWGYLRPGGRLVAIAGIGVTFYTDRKGLAFREWLDEIGATVERLPEGAFKASGTMVNAVLISATKG